MSSTYPEAPISSNFRRNCATDTNKRFKPHLSQTGLSKINDFVSGQLELPINCRCSPRKSKKARKKERKGLSCRAGFEPINIFDKWKSKRKGKERSSGQDSNPWATVDSIDKWTSLIHGYKPTTANFISAVLCEKINLGCFLSKYYRSAYQQSRTF